MYSIAVAIRKEVDGMGYNTTYVYPSIYARPGTFVEALQFDISKMGDSPVASGCGLVFTDDHAYMTGKEQRHFFYEDPQFFERAMAEISKALGEV